MKKTKAFTLVELLVVISIIAVLLAVLMPSLQKARSMATRTVCTSNIRQLTLAWRMYSDQNNGKLASALTGKATDWWMVQNGVLTNEDGWVGWLGKVIGNPIKPTSDPVLQTQEIQTGTLYPYVKNVKTYGCPVGEKNMMRSYSIFDAMNGCTDALTSVSISPSGMVYKKLTEIKRPSERGVFIDEGISTFVSWTIPYKAEAWGWEKIPLRHGKGTSLSFADGHSEYWTWTNPGTIKGDMNSGIGNKDLQRLQKAAWGKLGYTPRPN
ncbi:MAG: hypothetical protein UV78_C0020G0007 [Parcubacteria group bacterium GW2011_GWA2_43_17]|nr:MAG: hypothetical protein UV78_C0020G0007 [Parcubacteria group bacterium GW2011_GWA2_43_17]OHB43069.1 MAG: hypothetical protein A2Y13_00505 [Planctomycetes bacterium GWC2_45_44]